MTIRFVFPLAALALVAGCAGDAPTAPDADPAPELLRLARAYRMSGQALARTADGRTAECALDLVFELNERIARTGTTWNTPAPTAATSSAPSPPRTGRASPSRHSCSAP